MIEFWLLLRSILVIQLCFSLPLTQGINLDLGSIDSIKDVAKQLAASTMREYHGNEPGGTPGLLPGGTNWWEAGALFEQMVEYWFFTGDSTYNNITKQALLFQVGPNNAYEPTNQTRVEGNDDQAFWAFAAMSAAETKFEDPGPKQPSWLGLAQAVFNNQAHRWDSEHCDGGLRWQFNSMNDGWMMKNTISNGCFFQLAARLARYTKNQTYADWANRSYDWMTRSLISDKYEVFDSVSFTEKACNPGPDRTEWTYNIGTILGGSAYMYNYVSLAFESFDPGDTGRQLGPNAKLGRDASTDFSFTAQKAFIPDEYGGKIMKEYACESNGEKDDSQPSGISPAKQCNPDQRTFKAYFARWLAKNVMLAPFTAGTILPWLQGSAMAAVGRCAGTAPGIVCGRRWYRVDNEDPDIGHQMTVMSVVQSNLIQHAPELADLKTGTSVGNAGGGSMDRPATAEEVLATRPIGTGEKVGGWILTTILFVLVAGGAGFLVTSDNEIGLVSRLYPKWSGYR